MALSLRALGLASSVRSKDKAPPKTLIAGRRTTTLRSHKGYASAAHLGPVLPSNKGYNSGYKLPKQKVKKENQSL